MDYNLYDYNDAGIAFLLVFFIFYFLIVLVMAILSIIGMWEVFYKSRQTGMGKYCTFYNLYCLFDITFGSGWMWLLIFVPCVRIVFSIMLRFKLAKAFGKDTGFGFGLLFLPFVFFMILGFDKSEYLGPQP